MTLFEEPVREDEREDIRDIPFEGGATIPAKTTGLQRANWARASRSARIQVPVHGEDGSRGVPPAPAGSTRRRSWSCRWVTSTLCCLSSLSGPSVTKSLLLSALAVSKRTYSGREPQSGSRRLILPIMGARGQ